MTTTTLQDLTYQSLGNLSYTGSLPERKFNFFKDNGATSNNIVNAEFEWLASLGYTQPTLPDRRAARLRNLGYTDLSGYTAAFDGLLYYSNRNLFLNNEQGVWYDPSDLSTLFQDSAGTTPVTAAGQPVGLILDKSKGLVLGPELVTNGGFDSDTAWTKGTGVTISGGKINYSGFTTASTPTTPITIVAGRTYKLVVTGVTYVSGALTADFGGVSVSVPGPVSRLVTTTTAASLVLTSAAFEGSLSSISIQELPGHHASQSTAGSRPILRQTPVLGIERAPASNSISGWTPSNCTLAVVNGEIEITATATGVTFADFSLTGTLISKTYLLEVLHRVGQAAGTSYVALASGSPIYTAGNTAQVNAVGQVIKVSAATPEILRIRFDATVIGQKAYFAGFSVREITGYRTDQNYLEFDGVNDFLVTPSIDFTATDKMTVVVGVRKLNASAGTLVELSTAADLNNGAFAFHSELVAATYSFDGRGTSAFRLNTPAGYVPPRNDVLTGQLDIAASSRVVRTNGENAATSAATLGSGNFGNYPIYIGRRGGTSLPFNGYLYGLVVRGAASSSAQIIAAEREMAKRTGVVL